MPVAVRSRMTGDEAMSTTYLIAVVLAALAVIAALLFAFRYPRPDRRFSPRAALAFGFVIAGSLFGEERWLGYCLMGVGIVLAVVDILRQRRQGTL
jgi:EamA domain-containing membrane protein RarD